MTKNVVVDIITNMNITTTKKNVVADTIMNMNIMIMDVDVLVDILTHTVKKI